VTNAHAAIWVGLALGVSFGMGEAAYIAYSIELSPQYTGLSAAAFAGFGLERWITCLLHGVMTAVFIFRHSAARLAHPHRLSVGCFFTHLH